LIYPIFDFPDQGNKFSAFGVVLQIAKGLMFSGIGFSILPKDH